MSLYAISDLHLHYQSVLKAQNQLKDRVWKEHEEKFKKNAQKKITSEDTLILAGDHSWGKNLSECEKDLAYIMDLPGKKVLTRGNHDMFWDAGKTAHLNELYEGRLFFLQNNYYPYQDYALVGTKGFTFEGPFYLNRRGQIIGWDEEKENQAIKLVKREEERLLASIEAARKDGYKKFIMILHYPPTNILEKESCFTRIAKEYHVEQVIYGHCHGQSRFYDSLQGEHQGILYRLVSGDFLRWDPVKILD